MKNVIVVKHKGGFALKAIRPKDKKRPYFFTYYPTLEQARRVQNTIESTWVDIDNNVNFCWSAQDTQLLGWREKLHEKESKTNTISN